MSPAVWFLVGAFVGFDVVLAYAWLSTRRANRRLEMRWRIASYTGPNERWQRRPW